MTQKMRRYEFVVTQKKSEEPRLNGNPVEAETPRVVGVVVFGVLVPLRMMPPKRENNGG